MADNNKKYNVFQGQNFAFIIHGSKVFDFRNIDDYISGKVKIKIFIYPTNIAQEICSNTNKIKKIDSRFISTPNNVFGGWFPENTESDGYVHILPEEGDYGTCYFIFVWDETQFLEVGSYTVEVILSTGDDKSRATQQFRSFFKVTSSVGACVNKSFNLN